MDENILVLKQRGNKIKLKVSKKKKNQYSTPIYRKILNPNDANDLALFFGDLRIWFNSPIEKAFRILKEEADGLEKDFFLWKDK